MLYLNSNFALTAEVRLPDQNHRCCCTPDLRRLSGTVILGRFSAFQCKIPEQYAGMTGIGGYPEVQNFCL